VPHASDGLLRRLEDEPFAVPDAAFEHARGCDRCRGRRARIAAEAGVAARLLARPQPVADVDAGWRDLRHRLTPSRTGAGPARPARPARPVVRTPGRPGRVAGIPARTAVAGGAAAAVLMGTAAAATVRNVFAPTHVAPVTVTPSDVRALAGFLRLGDDGPLSGFPTPSGTGSLSFGTLRWTSSGAARRVPSVGAAQDLAGVPVPLPLRLPRGVGQPADVVVQPEVTATVTFDDRAGDLAGASVEVHAGPAAFVSYGSSSAGPGIPTLGVLTMRRPTASTTGATIDRVSAFLLTQPEVPPGLAEQLRLLGDLSTVMPVPAPAGMTSRSVPIGGHPGVVIAEPSGVAAGAVWEDDRHVVHAVGGLVDEESVLDVADQIR
jgi:hypothetical protein